MPEEVKQRIPNDWVTVYHVKDGPKTIPRVDANYAINSHPTEWSDEPWPTAGGNEGDVEIPEDFHNLTAAKRRALAMKLGADNTITVKDAEHMIEAELAKRAKAKARAGKDDE